MCSDLPEGQPGSTGEGAPPGSNLYTCTAIQTCHSERGGRIRVLPLLNPISELSRCSAQLPGAPCSPTLSPTRHIQSPCVRTLDLTASHLPTCQLTHLSTELAPTLKGHLQGQAFLVFLDGESCPPPTIPNLNMTSLTVQHSHLPHPTEVRCSQL